LQPFQTESKKSLLHPSGHQSLSVPTEIQASIFVGCKTDGETGKNEGSGHPTCWSNAFPHAVCDQRGLDPRHSTPTQIAALSKQADALQHVEP